MRTYDGKPDRFLFWFVIGFSLFFGTLIGYDEGLLAIIVCSVCVLLTLAVLAGIAGND